MIMTFSVERSQMQFAAPGVVTSGPEGRAHQSLEHTVDGLDLPTLRVARTLQDAFHAGAPEAARAFLRRSTDQRRNERVHAAFFASVLMRLLGVVTGVGDQTRRSEVARALRRARGGSA